jgi:hypothetical protein
MIISTLIKFGVCKNYVEILAFILGALVTCVVDTFWWEIDYKKAEKGLEWHEHYHVGLELVIVGMIIALFNEFAAAILYGAGLLFILAEWRQVVEIKGNKVIPGHPFAYGSSHFKISSIVGGILVVLSVITYLYLVPMVESIK